MKYHAFLGDFKAAENLHREKAMKQAFAGGSRGLGGGHPSSCRAEHRQPWLFSFVALSVPRAWNCLPRRRCRTRGFMRHKIEQLLTE